MGPFSIASFRFGLFSASGRRETGFLSLSISVQTAAGQGWRFRPWAPTWAVTRAMGAAGSAPAEPLQPEEVLGLSAATMGCCVRGCGGFYDHHLLNVSGADAGEE